MFGCLRRLGCLVVILVAAGLYFGRDYWLPVWRSWRGADTVAEESTGSEWQPLTQEAAGRGERAVRALAARGGPVYVNLRAGELASYAFLSLSNGLPAGAEGAEAAVVGERVYLRAVVSLKDLGAAAGAAGGAFGGLLAERDTLRLGGSFDVVRPGLAQFRVRDVQLGSFPLPERTIPGVIRRVRRGEVPEGVAPDALPFEIPPYIGDVRVARGRVTLYKATP